MTKKLMLTMSCSMSILNQSDVVKLFVVEDAQDYEFEVHAVNAVNHEFEDDFCLMYSFPPLNFKVMLEKMV